MNPSDVAREYPILDLLPRDWPGTRRSGKGWMTCCPFHEDKRPSMFVSQEPDGHWLWHCQAGCGGGSSIDFYLRLHGGRVADVIRELAGPEPRSRMAVMQQRNRDREAADDAAHGRAFYLLCEECGEGRDRAIRLADVKGRVELLESVGWYVFPNHGGDIARAVFCPRHADKALAYAAGIMLGDGVVPDDGPPSEWVRIARAG